MEKMLFLLKDCQKTWFSSKVPLNYVIFVESSWKKMQNLSVSRKNVMLVKQLLKITLISSKYHINLCKLWQKIVKKMHILLKECKIIKWSWKKVLAKDHGKYVNFSERLEKNTYFIEESQKKTVNFFNELWKNVIFVRWSWKVTLILAKDCEKKQILM